MVRVSNLTGLLLLLSLPAAAEIYRCEVEGVVVFTDRPCHADAQPYRAKPGLSVVSAPDNLAEVAEQNRAWLAAEQQRQDQQRAARAARAASSAAARKPATTPRGPAQGSGHPVFALPYFAPPLPPQADRRLHAQRQGPAREEAADARFSALGGRQPGSRRDP
jgi:hypothetical protein